MKINTIQTTLAAAIMAVMVTGCGGGGGGAKTEPSVTTPPTGGTTTPPTGGGGTTTPPTGGTTTPPTGGGGTTTPPTGGGGTTTPPTGGGGTTTPPTGGTTTPPTGGGGTTTPPTGGGGTTTPPVDGGTTTPPTPSYTYNKAAFNVADTATSTKKIAVGVADSGLQVNPYLQHSVQKVLKYVTNYLDGSMTIEDLTNAGIDVQDMNQALHGTMVGQVIAGKIPANADSQEKRMKEGAAKDVAQLYGIQNIDKTAGYFTTTGMLQGMVDLNKKHGVKLFNASFSSDTTNSHNNETMLRFIAELADGNALVVFSSGNGSSYQPSVESLLPVGNAKAEKAMLVATGVDSTRKNLGLGNVGGANACGDAARWCLAADFVYGNTYHHTNDRLVSFAGTSASAPQVTAAAALVWSKYSWLTADQVRQFLLTTADYIDDGSGANKLYNSTFGWGYLDTDKALKGAGLFSKEFGANFEATVTGVSVFSNNIGGDAGLVKNGDGTLVLSGQNTYTGANTVNRGKLRVTGAIKGATTVNANGVLSGNGDVGAVVNNGTVSTADGRLTVNGNYTQGANGVLNYDLHHFLTVKGNASLDGTLAVSAQSKDILTKGEHTVLTANSVSGGFTDLQSISPFLAVGGLSQTATGVTVLVDHANAVSAGYQSSEMTEVSGSLINDLMDKANDQALSGQSTALTAYVAGLQSLTSKASAQSVLASNSGAVFVQTPSVLLRNEAMVNSQVVQRSQQLLKGDGGVWLGGTHLNNNNSASGWGGVDSNVNTVSVGADTQVGDNVGVGAYVTQYQDKSKFDDTLASTETDVTNFGGYMKWQSPSSLYLAANAQYGLGDVEFKRFATDGLVGEDLKSSSDLTKYGVYGEVGYGFTADSFTITPYLGLGYSAVELDGVQEQSDLGLTVGDVSVSETKAHIGVRFDYGYNQNLTFTGYGEYANAFDRGYDRVSLAMNVDTTTGVLFAPPVFDKDYFLYGVGFNYQGVQNWNFFGDVSGNALDSNDYQLQLGLKYNF